MVHAALNDRMLNAEKFSDTGFHIYLPRKSAATLRRQAQSANENYSFGRLSSRPPPPRVERAFTCRLNGFAICAGGRRTKAAKLPSTFTASKNSLVGSLADLVACRQLI
jgi:hypothetical protein